MATRQQIARWMPEIWQWANDTIFGGMLPRPSFYYNSDKENGGLMYVVADRRFRYQHHVGRRRHVIEISTRVIKSKRILRSVMIHEMIHQLQHLQKSKRTRFEHHGRFFQRWADNITIRHGIPIAVAVDDLAAMYANAKA